jgi:hypothetical protein
LSLHSMYPLAHAPVSVVICTEEVPDVMICSFPHPPNSFQ